MTDNNKTTDFSSIKTLSEMLDLTFSCFDVADLYYGHGTDSAWDEAVQLVLYVMDLPIDSGSEVNDLPVSKANIDSCEKLIADRISTRQPLAYLIKQAWFMQLPFYVDQRVIVPRSPFAEWIGQQFQPWLNVSNIHTILDLCCGSACIAIAAACKFPEATVTAIDIDADALQVAAINVANYNLQSRVSLLESDGFSKLTTEKFDLIISNPPYVSSIEMESLPAEYLCEPTHALEAEDNGLALVFKWLSQAANHLSSDGVLFMEVGNNDLQLQERVPTVPFMWLEQQHGGHGIFMLKRNDLISFKNVFEQQLNLGEL